MGKNSYVNLKENINYCILSKKYFIHIRKCNIPIHCINKISEIKHCLAANAATLAPRVAPGLDQALIPTNQRSRMHLHKVIASRAKVQITAQKRKLGLRMSLVANGMRILTCMASGDPGVLGKSLKGLRHNVKVIAIVARNLRKKGK